MKLSIVIPFYKTYELTCILLDNLCSQIKSNVEIILIDDGCNENRLDSYPINIIHLEENRGLSYARNRGIEQAQGKYVAFIDSDDNVSNMYIETILNKIKTSEFDYCLFSWKFTGIKTEEVIIKDEAPDWNRCVWNCVYKRENIGLFEEGVQIHEDSIFNLKYRKGVKANIEEVLYYYWFNRKDSISNRFFDGKTKVQEEWSETTLSIIIPYYNTYDLTCKLLDELSSQYCGGIEIILVQDGCNDNFDKYPIKNIKQENKGVSSARNKGLDNAIGKYIVFIDSDDMIKPNYISSILEKINKNKFDYCYFGWEATGRINGKFVIADNPPSWNTCVWNCIYSKELIGNNRFNEKLIIEEDLEFNKIVRHGNKSNIEDILYIYNSGREGSITSTYRSSEVKTKEYTGKEEIPAQVIIYRSFLSKLGGIETAVYNACEALKDKYDVMFVYDTTDTYQIKRLRKLVKCVQFDGQHFTCDTFIYYGANPQKIEEFVDAKETIQQICNNVDYNNYNFVISPKTTKIFADSQASAIAFTNKYPQYKCGVLYNLFNLPPTKRALRLVSATRLSKEKGYERMKEMAKTLNAKQMPFTWEVFTNDLPNEEIDGFVFRKPRLDVINFLKGKDYTIQLSDTESWGCTVTESLELGTPVICTDYPSSTEQVEEGLNGFILKRDLTNLSDVVDKIYSSDLKGFEYHKKDNVKQWCDAIGKLDKPKGDYTYEEPEFPEVKVLIATYYSLEEQRYEVGDTFFVKDAGRLQTLLGDNANHQQFVEIIN